MMVMNINLFGDHFAVQILYCFLTRGKKISLR